MRYSLNIARHEGFNHYDGKKHRKYIHYARVELGNVNREEAIAKAKVFENAFPSPGYQLKLTKWVETGHDVPLRNSLEVGLGESWTPDDDNPAYAVPTKAEKIAAASYDMQTLDMARD